MDIDKILGISKKKKTPTQFSNLSMSGIFGKNPFSDLIGKVTDKPTKKLLGASPKMQDKWFNMNHNQRNVARKKYKDTDGDRIPNRFDCSPRNVMKQDFGNQPIAHLSIQQQYEKFKLEQKPILITPLDVEGYSYFELGPSWVEHDDKSGKIVSQGPPDRIYYHPSTKNEALNIRNLMQQKNKYNVDYHISMGKNLGYSKNETFNFIKQLPEYNQATKEKQIFWYNMVYQN